MNPITQDQFFSQLFQTGLSDPNSRIYLPGIILSSGNPSLNPYSVSSIDLGNQSIGSGISVDVLLTNLTVSGIPNVSVASSTGGSLQITGLNAASVAQFCVLNPPPPNVGLTIIVKTQFTLTAQGVGSLPGSFSMSISAATLNGTFAISGQNFTSIVITLNSLAVSVPSSAIVTPIVTFQNPSSFWSNLFENYLKQPSTIQTITSHINTALTGQLPQLSTQLTQIIQNALQQQLGIN